MLITLDFYCLFFRLFNDNDSGYFKLDLMNLLYICLTSHTKYFCIVYSRSGYFLWNYHEICIIISGKTFVANQANRIGLPVIVNHPPVTGPEISQNGMVIKGIICETLDLVLLILFMYSSVLTIYMPFYCTVCGYGHYLVQSKAELCCIYSILYFDQSNSHTYWNVILLPNVYDG